MKASGAGALFYGGYDAQAALFAKALKTAGYTGITMTGNGGKSSKFTSGAGDAGNGWYFSCGCLDATSPRRRRPSTTPTPGDVQHPAVDLLARGVRRDQRHVDGDQERGSVDTPTRGDRLGRGQQGRLQGHHDRGQVPADR